MAKPIHKTLGGKPEPVAAFERDRRVVSSSGEMHAVLCDGAWRPSTCTADRLLRNLVGAIGRPGGVGWLRPPAPDGRGRLGAPLPVTVLLLSNRQLPGLRLGLQDSYLVDSASSHMLVSKIKPCMSKYKQSIP